MKKRIRNLTPRNSNSNLAWGESVAALALTTGFGNSSPSVKTNDMLCHLGINL
jgi:hypothetical protein